MTLKIGSLFSGYGGLDLAVQQVYDAEPAWHVEFDAAPSKILAHHWPHVPNLHDVTTVDWAQVEPVDILTAGYPCQPFSTAGERRGTDDDRHLWPHVATAAEALRPALIVLENVRGHLTLGFDTVLTDLDVLEYDAAWTIYPASAAGAPHRRDRLFILATRRSTSDPRSHHPRREALGCGIRSVRDSRVPGAHAPGRHHAGGSRLLPTPVVTDRTGTRNETAGRRPGAKFASGRTLSDVVRLDAWDEYAGPMNHWAAVTGHAAPEPTEPGRDLPRLAPAFSEWLMGLEPGHVTGVPGLTRKQQLTALGNGVVPQQGAAALAHLHTIRSTNP